MQKSKKVVKINPEARSSDRILDNLQGEDILEIIAMIKLKDGTIDCVASQGLNRQERMGLLVAAIIETWLAE